MPRKAVRAAGTRLADDPSTPTAKFRLVWKNHPGDWPQNKIAEIAGVTRETVGMWVTTSRPSPEAVLVIVRQWGYADSLVDWVFNGRDENPPITVGTIKGRLVHESEYPDPVADVVRGSYADIECWRYHHKATWEAPSKTQPGPVIRVPRSFASGKKIACVVGSLDNCLSPEAEQGEVLVFEYRGPDDPPPLDTLVFATKGEQGIAHVLRKSSKGYELHFVNDACGTSVSADGWTIFGSAIAIIGDYRINSMSLRMDLDGIRVT